MVPPSGEVNETGSWRRSLRRLTQRPRPASGTVAAKETKAAAGVLEQAVAAEAAKIDVAAEEVSCCFWSRISSA